MITPPPPPIQLTTTGFEKVDNYGSYGNRNLFLGRGHNSFTTWADVSYTYCILQLPMGQQALRTTNEYFSYTLHNIGFWMYGFNPADHLPHTQKKLLKRSNFRYLSEIASSAYTGNKATLSAPTLQQYTFPDELPPPPTQFDASANYKIDKYGTTTALNEFAGRNRHGLSTWNDATYSSSLVQLQLNQEAVALLNEFFAFSIQNIGQNMYYYDAKNHLPHTQKRCTFSIILVLL